MEDSVWTVERLKLKKEAYRALSLSVLVTQKIRKKVKLALAGIWSPRVISDCNKIIFFQDFGRKMIPYMQCRNQSTVVISVG